MRIILPAEFAVFTDNQTEIDVKAATPKTGLTALLNRYPQLYMHLLGPEAAAERYACILDDEWFLDSSNCGEVVRQLEFVEVPSGQDPVSLGFAIIMAVDAAVGGVAIGAATAIAASTITAAIVGGLAMAAISMGISMLTGMIMGTPDTGALSAGSLGGNTYSFNGVSNSTAPGTVVPVVYGTHRVGGQVLSISTYTQDETVSGVIQSFDYLKAIVALSEGPIAGVSEVQISGYPTNYFDGWEDPLNPYSYSLGHTDVSSVVLPKMLTSTLPDSIPGVKVVYKPVVWTFDDVNNPNGNVYGDLSAFNIVENTNSNVNNPVVKSIKGLATVNTSDTQWVIDTSIPPWPAVGSGRYANSDGSLPWLPMYDRPYYKSEITRDRPYNNNGLTWIRREVAILSSILEFAPGQTLDGILQSGGITKVSTTTPVTGFRVKLTFPMGLYGVNSSTGDFYTVSVPIAVFYRPTGAGDWTLLTTQHIARSERGEYSREISSYTLPEAIYEIAIVRFDDISEGRYLVNDLKVTALTEIITAGLGYPYTAILGIGLRATDQLNSAVPTLSALVKGRVIKVPDIVDGVWLLDEQNRYKMKDAWSDNPVWCLYDLLTNTRYGLGEYYPIAESKRNITLANFHFHAQYCDEPLPYLDEDGQPILENGLPKTRKRFTLNLVLDQSKSAAEWVDTIKAVIRANVFYNQGLFWIDIDRPKLVSQIFNASNLTEYSQSGTSYHSIPNVIEAQYPNPGRDYTMDVFRVESYEYLADAALEERKKLLNAVGVTDIEQVKSLVKFIFNKSKLTKQVSFKTGSEGIRCQVNDVIGVTHDTPMWGAGGRIASWSGTTSITVTTDIPLVPANITNNKIYVSDYTGEVKELTIISATETGFTYNKSANDNYEPNRVDSSGTVHKDVFSYGTALFKVVSIQKDSDLLSTIVAAEYASELYALCDDTSDMSTIVPENYSDIPVPYKTSVDGVQVTVNVKLDNTVFRPVVLISYVVPNTSGFSSVDVYMSPTSALNFTKIITENTNQQIEYTPNVPDGEYIFIVTANYGPRKQSLYDALQDTSVTNRATVKLASLPSGNVFSEGVTGLAIQNRDNDNTFYGKDCIVVWNKPLVVSIDASAGTEAKGAGTIQTDSWFSHYIVEVSNIDKTSRRKSRVVDTIYAYTHEMNHQDGVSREFDITVTVFDILGRPSTPKTITCKNPAPAALV